MTQTCFWSFLLHFFSFCKLFHCTTLRFSSGDRPFACALVRLSLGVSNPTQLSSISIVFLFNLSCQLKLSHCTWKHVIHSNLKAEGYTVTFCTSVNGRCVSDTLFFFIFLLTMSARVDKRLATFLQIESTDKVIIKALVVCSFFSTVYELKNIKIILNHSEFNWVSWVMPMIYGQPIYILYFIFKFFFFIFMFPPSLPLFASVCFQFMRVASWRSFSSGDLFIYYCVRSMQKTIIWMSIGKFKLILPIYKTEHYYLSVCLSDWITWLVQSDSLCLPSSSVLSSLRIWWWHCLHCALNDVNENI